MFRCGDVLSSSDDFQTVMQPERTLLSFLLSPLTQYDSALLVIRPKPIKLIMVMFQLVMVTLPIIYSKWRWMILELWGATLILVLVIGKEDVPTRTWLFVRRFRI